MTTAKEFMKVIYEQFTVEIDLLISNKILVNNNTRNYKDSDLRFIMNNGKKDSDTLFPS